MILTDPEETLKLLRELKEEATEVPVSTSHISNTRRDAVLLSLSAIIQEIVDSLETWNVLALAGINTTLTIPSPDEAVAHAVEAAKQLISKEYK